eukprot:scaffold80215_cov62-Phaeocystis_antarctica.AAC.5
MVESGEAASTTKITEAKYPMSFARSAADTPPKTANVHRPRVAMAPPTNVLWHAANALCSRPISGSRITKVASTAAAPGRLLATIHGLETVRP